jgi:hypothetical protein
LSTKSHDQIEQRERAILARLPFDAQHVPNSECQDYDAVLEEPYTTGQHIRIIGRARLEAGTPIELKTCQEWIDDNGSWNGRRRGTFRVQQDTHERLEDAGGVYCLLVMDGDDILTGRLLEPEHLESCVNSWTNGGAKYQSDRAHVSWGSIMPPSSIQEVAHAD